MVSSGLSHFITALETGLVAAFGVSSSTQLPTHVNNASTHDFYTSAICFLFPRGALVFPLEH